MPHKYARQRQGRDFPNHKRETEHKKSMLDRLEHYKTEAKRNSAPVDGCEPTPETPDSEKERV